MATAALRGPRIGRPDVRAALREWRRVAPDARSLAARAPLPRDLDEIQAEARMVADSMARLTQVATEASRRRLFRDAARRTRPAALRDRAFKLWLELGQLAAEERRER